MNPQIPETTTVGSYPTPIWLRSFSTKDNLRDAIMLVLKIQEDAGLDLLVDGELYRWNINHGETNGMIDYFIGPMHGIRKSLTRIESDGYRNQRGMAYRSEPAGIVVDKLGPGNLNLLKDYEFVKQFCHKPLKFTITSPYMLARVLSNKLYSDFNELVMAIAEILADQLIDIDADVIQIDEANLTGHPEDAEIAAQAINRTFKHVKGRKGVHLCFGNYGGQTVQQGTYDCLIGFINSLTCDHVVLEMARRPQADEKILREIKPEIGVGLGVIDIKDNQVESPDIIAKRIESAAKICGQERIHYVHPDCGMWMLPRSVADEKIRVLVKGRDLFAGRIS